MKSFDTDFVRSFFPGLHNDWILMDNAGGTQIAKQVVSRMNDYLYNTNVQLGASYDISKMAGERVKQAQQEWGSMINAKDETEVILGSSTTQLLHNLSKSLAGMLKAGDEVIVTNTDHEANIGPWLNLQKYGIVVKSWKISTDTLRPEINDLEKLMTSKTRLVAFTHVSNILGTINPVKEITRFVHERGAMVCVDGVAFAPHRKVDVNDLDVDFYVFSLYKVYGPHYSLLYGKKEILENLPGINHYFIGKDQTPYKLQPGNVNYELSYGLLGIIDYFKEVYKFHFDEKKGDLSSLSTAVFNLMADHEESLSEILLDFLRNKKGVNIFGEPIADKNHRVPTISFIVDGRKSSAITSAVDSHQIAIRYGDFYALRLITDLGLLKNDGVVRVSMVHYNTEDEVKKLVKVLDEVI